MRTFSATFIESEAPHSARTHPAFAPQTAGTGSSCHPTPCPRLSPRPVPEGRRSANRKMKPNETFSGKLLSNYTAMLRYTQRLASSLLSPASVLLCQGEGGIDVGPFMEPATPFGVDLARRILRLSGRGELTGTRQRRDPHSGLRRGGVSWHRARSPSSHCWTDKGPERGANAFV